MFFPNFFITFFFKFCFPNFFITFFFEIFFITFFFKFCFPIFFIKFFFQNFDFQLYYKFFFFKILFSYFFASSWRKLCFHEKKVKILASEYSEYSKTSRNMILAGVRNMSVCVRVCPILNFSNPDYS